MKKTFHPLLTLSITAMADLNDERRLIGFDGNVCAAAAKALGSLAATTAAGEQAPVDAIGVILVEAGGAIALGAQIQSDATGRAVTLAGGLPNGWAMDAATAAGEIIRIARGL